MKTKLVTQIGNFFMVVMIVITGFVFPQSSVQAATVSAELPSNMSFSNGWETSITGANGWSGSQIKGTDRFQRVTSPVRSGNYSARIEVRPGDNFSGSSGERSEVYYMQDVNGNRIAENELSGTQYYTISVYLPENYTPPLTENSQSTNKNVWGVVFQLHGPDVYGSSPAFELEALDKYTLSMSVGDLAPNLWNGKTYQFSDSSLNLGHWTDFVFKIKYAKDSTGSVDVWRRNEGVTGFTNVLSVTNTPTLQYSSNVNNGAVGDHYWKTGFYRNIDPTLVNVLYIDSVSRGTSFDSVVASAFPTANPSATPTPLGSTPTNVAIGKPATESSDYNEGMIDLAMRAVDGNTDGTWNGNSITHTNTDAQAWWQVDLTSSFYINYINIWNRTDCCGSRLSDYYVLVSDNPFTSSDLTSTINQSGVSAYHFADAAGSPTKVNVNRSGRYVRVQLNGTNILHMAEVEVFATGGSTNNTPTAIPTTAPTATVAPTNVPTIAPTQPAGSVKNVAIGKSASESSNFLKDYPDLPQRAVDGNTDGIWSNNSVTHTDADSQAWWQIDLASSYAIKYINVWNRADCCSSRLSEYFVFVSDQPFASTNLTSTISQPGVSAFYFSEAAGSPTVLNVNRTGRYVRVQLSGTNNLSLAEVEVFASDESSGSIDIPTSTPLPTNTPTAVPTSTAVPTNIPTLAPSATSIPVDPSIQNVAIGKSASESSNFLKSYTDLAQRAVDGDTDGIWNNNSVTHTDADFQAWWQVDLAASYSIKHINIWNRTDCCSSRLSDFFVLVSDEPFTSTSLDRTLEQPGVSAFYFSDAIGNSTVLNVNRSGRYIRVQLDTTNNLSLAEVEIFASTQLPTAIAIPTNIPTTVPTSTPLPTNPPTAIPTATALPTNTPTPVPTSIPTKVPTAIVPTTVPTAIPAETTIRNVAVGKAASESSNFLKDILDLAQRAVDGNTDGIWNNNSVTHTNNDAQAWWQVDLGSSYSIKYVNIWNRTDCCASRVKSFYVFVSDTPFTSSNLNSTINQSGVSAYYISSTAGRPTTINVNRTGRYVRVQLKGTNYLNLAEVEVFASVQASPTSIPTNVPTKVPTLMPTTVITTLAPVSTATPMPTATQLPQTSEPTLMPTNTPEPTFTPTSLPTATPEPTAIELPASEPVIAPTTAGE